MCKLCGSFYYKTPVVVLKSVYTKCDFNPICCRMKFHPIFDVSS